MYTTQQYVPIADIRDDLVFLKDGSISVVFNTSAVNFGLLFETEQIGIIDSFAGLLNSLSFPIQIVIRSKRLDISSYLNTLSQAKSKQPNPLLAQMISHYQKFVESLIKENDVLDKQFYICTSVTPLELGIMPKKDAAEQFKKAMVILAPRRDHLLRQTARIGLKAKQLTTVELIKLFYDIYNPLGSELTSDNFLQENQPQGKAVIAPVAPSPTVPQGAGNYSVVVPRVLNTVGQSSPFPTTFAPPTKMGGMQSVTPNPLSGTVPTSQFNTHHLSPLNSKMQFVTEELSEDAVA